MSLKPRLLKLETAANVNARNNQPTPEETLASYKYFYPDSQLTIDPNFKFKHDGPLTITDMNDFFAAIGAEDGEVLLNEYMKSVCEKF